MTMAPVVGVVAIHSANSPRPVGEDAVDGACAEVFDTDLPSSKPQEGLGASSQAFSAVSRATLSRLHPGSLAGLGTPPLQARLARPRAEEGMDAGHRNTAPGRSVGKRDSSGMARSRRG